MRILKSIQTKVCVDGSLMKEYVLDEPLTDSFLKFLDSKDVQYTKLETPGAHTWMVWRRNLAQFVTLLFGS